MMLKPLKDLIALKPRPETTLSLERALQEGAKTVSSYRFTPSIQDYCSEIFEVATAGRGQGYWIQAEYGAGKTHLLSTLGILLTDSDSQAWESVADDDIRNLKSGLFGRNRLFRVVVNCKGSIAADGGESSLLRLLERAISSALDQAGLHGKAAISTSDEVREWWEKRAPLGVKTDITQQVQKNFTGNPSPADLLEKKGEETFAQAIMAAAKALNIEIPLSRDVRTRFQHIYRQLTSQLGYQGLLVIIDEFKSWQDLHPTGSPGFAEAEHVLETLAFHLPADDHAFVTTIIASQSAPPAKLSGGATGDRFRTFPLFSREESVREYDEIVAFRVREVKSDRMPEVDQYYNHYYQKFRFLSQTKKDYFRQTFPFQPRCFEIIRNIAKRELATARSSIHYVHEVLSQTGTLDRRGLIKVCDLMQSENLVKDLQTAAYKDAYVSYQSGIQALPDLFDEPQDRQLAEDVIKTLFLAYCASSDAPRGMTAVELAEACLATDEDLKSEDLIAGIILPRLKELSQVEYTNKEKGAFFRVSQVSGPTYTQILGNFQRRVDNDNEAGPEWLKLLTAASQVTAGVPMLFGGRTIDKPEKATGRANKVRYEGESVISREWSRSWRGLVIDRTNYNQHFRIVYLLEPGEVSPEDFADERTAVVIPASWKETAQDEMRRYCAALRVEKEYAPQHGPDAEEIKQSNKNKKQEFLDEIRRKQIEAYRRGRIVTRSGLGIDPNQVFANPEKADEAIASALLAHAYQQPPFDPDQFKRELSATEPGRIFAALFQQSNSSADVGALENFGVGLGLSRPGKPLEFDPERCNFFEVLRTEVEQAEGDLKLYSFYEKYTGAPWGVPIDLLSLYLLAFVRHARPQCVLSVKPESSLTLSTGRSLHDNRLSYGDVPQLAWLKNKLHRSFDRLIQESGPGWNDFVEYFREFDDTLRATESPQEVAIQQDRLSRIQADLTAQIRGLRSRLTGLAGRLNQNIAPQLKIIDDIDAVCQTDARHLRNFESVLEGRFDRDPAKYKSVFAAFRKIEELDRTHMTAISEAVSYLERIAGLQEGSDLADELKQAWSGFLLSELCVDPSQSDQARRGFETFRDRYAAVYQAHYRDQREALIELHSDLEGLTPMVAGLGNINSIEDLGTNANQSFAGRHQELLKRTDASHLQEGLPDVERHPIVNNVRLDTRTPAAEVAAFKSDLEVAQIRGLELLAPEAICNVLEKSDDKDIRRLVDAVTAGDAERVAVLFTRSVAAKVKDLLRQARMVVVEVSLSDYGPVQIGDPSEVDEAVKKFETFLRSRLSNAKKNNTGKIVRLNLK
jgi:hypothetical protein